MQRLAPLLVIVAAALCWLVCLDAPGQTVRVYRSWTQAQLVDVAAVHASQVPPAQQPFIRYVDLHAVAPAQRARALQVLSGVLNSLSRFELLALAQEVPGTEGALAWIDLSRYRPRHDAAGLKAFLAALDRLGELGSGPAPFPEPYYHATAIVAGESYERVWWPGGYDRAYGRSYAAGFYRVKKRVTRRQAVALGPWLNKATAVGLAATVQSNFPVFEYHWFTTYALLEPRYHELLGLDDSIRSVQQLAGLDPRVNLLAGSQLRGAVLFSDVAHRNRALRRTPTGLRYGRGAFHESLDFKTSLAAQDVLKDLQVDRVDARELIWTLPNGLHGYFIVDGANKRLDKADADIAAARSLPFSDTQVRTALSCMGCHWKANGLIEIDDEVREYARHPVTLYVDALQRKGHLDRAASVRQQYLDVDANELYQQDQQVFKAALRAGTGGLTPPEAIRLLIDGSFQYLEGPISLDRLALELGFPREAVAAAAGTPGLDHVFPGLLAGRKQRRDQVEAGFGQIATILYLGKYK